MKKLKITAIAIGLIISMVLPLALCIGMTTLLKPVYKETFLGELAEKYTLLTSTEGPKTIIVGGSSVAFGLDSERLEEITGRKTINFGLYATLGTKLMLDLSEANISEGDIIVLAPELDEQTLSLYFNGEATLQALESKPEMLKYVGCDNYGDLLAALPEYLGTKIDYNRKGLTISPSGIYRRDSFNEYGDIVYPREYNVMTYEYDKNQPIELVPELFDSEFIEYLNKYIAGARKKGAEVYFSFCPVNASALVDTTTDETIVQFVDFIRENVECEIISNPNDSIMDKGYFYDTNFHLNDAGVQVHTARLAEDILRVLGRTEATGIDEPTPPGKKPDDDSGVETVDPAADNFEIVDRNGIVTIVGVKENAQYMTELDVPKYWNNKKVLAIAANAFSKCTMLRTVNIYENITSIEDEAFNGCSSLTAINMRREEADTLEVGEKLLEGVNSKVKICMFTESSFANFAGGYFWGPYTGNMQYVKE